MKERDPQPAGSLSMVELFCAEVENQTALLNQSLLELEGQPASAEQFESLMRAAHSIKGAARIVNLQAAVRVAHALEDWFVAARRDQFVLSRPHVDLLLQGVDLLANLGRRSESNLNSWETEFSNQIQSFLFSLSDLTKGFAENAKTAPTWAAKPRRSKPSSAKPTTSPIDTGAVGSKESSEQNLEFAETPPTPYVPHSSLVPPPMGSSPVERPAEPLAIRKAEPPERVLRLGAENLNRLLGLAGESLVETRWLRPFADSLERLKRGQAELAQQIERLRNSWDSSHQSERTHAYFAQLAQHVTETQQFLTERIQELDKFDRRSAHLAQRLYLEVLRTRMRPFSEGVRRFPRMVRDLARSLGKEVKLDVSGEDTQVDRDILERLETPLAHLLRNAVDHGCERPDIRRGLGKPAECTVTLEARHSAGVLLVVISDDGAGIDVASVRRAIVDKNIIAAAQADKLSEAELIEFLFLPGFTLRQTVSEISGRGFGLDVVKNMIKSVRGSIRIQNQTGRGLRVQLQLPLTLSVLRALLVEIAGEPYAIPLNQISRALKLPRSHIQNLEGRQTFLLEGEPIVLVDANQVLGTELVEAHGEELSVVVLGDRSARYGLVVERFLSERELVVQPLDPRLGKVQDISAAALMEDGSPVLIIDVEQILRSLETHLEAGGWADLHPTARLMSGQRPKRVLAVDDSLSVRELERQLLSSRGYQTDVASNGFEAWNALRLSHYDLVITDIDMPGLDGIALATRIKQDAQFRNIPVLVISYKDREEDRLRGLEAGADYYLTKASFHDETLLQAVADLIGEAKA